MENKEIIIKSSSDSLIRSKSQITKEKEKLLEKNKESIFFMIQKNIFKFVECIPFQCFLIFLTIFSVFNNEIRLAFLSYKVDHTFHFLNDMVFGIFVTEFLIIIFCKKNYLFTFYFWMEVTAIFSLFPETSFIWIPLMREISGM